MSRNEWFVRLLLILGFTVVNAGPAFPQDDAYHAWLQDHLAQEYGVTGGTWAFSDSEVKTLGLAAPSTGVTMQSFSTSGQEFTNAIKLTVPQAAPNPWDRTVRFLIQQPAQAGDAMLLCVWLRHVWPESEEGLVETIFEISESPYTKSLIRGYNLPDEWTLFVLPFENDVTVQPGEARFQMNMGRQRQITDLGGLALINFGSSYNVDDLPTVTPPATYSGRDPDASWRAPARERIEQFRMSDIEVLVVGESGEPVEDAAVQVTMRRHAFGFGTAISTGLMAGPAVNEEYRTRVADLTGDGRTFNIAVLENALKWGPWESDWPVSKSQKGTVVAWLLSRGMDVRGHNLVWPQWQYLPADIEDNRNNLTYVTDRIRNHIKEEAGFPGLKGMIREWDVVNEPTHTTDLRDIYRGSPGYPTGEEIYADWFRWTEEADPNARLFVNDYSIVSAYGPSAGSTARPYYKQIIQNLLAAEVRLDGIGIQAHMSSPLTPIDTVYKVIEEFGAFGLGISVSEYDTPDMDDDLAADYMRDFLTMAFSHPAVESFLMWGFWDGAHWHDNAPIFRHDWSIKPSGRAFIDLVFKEWWTDEQGVTDSDGLFKLRGVHGEYDVTVTDEGKSLTARATVTEIDPTRVVISLAVSATASEHPDAKLRVEPNYPNPFFGKTTLPFSLPQPANVRIAIFDMTGRQVSTHEAALALPGRQTVALDLGDLPSGLYVYRMEAGNQLHTGYLSHLGN